MKTQTLGVMLTVGVLLISCAGEGPRSTQVLEAREIPDGPQCNTYESVKQQLQVLHKEDIVASGISHLGTMRLELYATPTGSTWSLLFIGVEGYTCLVAAGTGFRIKQGEKVNFQQLVEMISVRTY